MRFAKPRKQLVQRSIYAVSKKGANILLASLLLLGGCQTKEIDITERSPIENEYYRAHMSAVYGDDADRDIRFGFSVDLAAARLRGTLQ